MIKYLCSLEPHYIIFSYGKQLICILEWTQLQWYVGEINGKKSANELILTTDSCNKPEHYLTSNIYY